MARPRKARTEEVKEEQAVGYSIVESETTGYLVKHGDKPVYVAASKEQAEAYVALVDRK